MTERSLKQLPSDLRQELEYTQQLLNRQKQILQDRIARRCQRHYHDCLVLAEWEGHDDPQMFAREQVDEFSQHCADESAPELEHLEQQWRNAVEQTFLRAQQLATDGPTAFEETPTRFETPMPCAITPPDFLAGVEAVEKRGSPKKLKAQHGLLVVQSAADVDVLSQEQILAVGLTRPQPHPKQIDRIVALTKTYSEAKLQTWLPLDEAGRKAMWALVQQLLPEVFVHVPITTQTKDGIFAEKSPSELTQEELAIARQLFFKK